MRKPIFFVIALVVLISLACGFDLTTANVKEAKMARDPDGEQPTTTFGQEDTFYLVAEVANAPDDTILKAVWIAVEVDGVEPGFSLGEKELSASGAVNFSLENDQFWPVGKYKVDLYLEGELDRTLDFEVEGEVVAEKPTYTPEPAPSPTPTPISESREALQSSTGDSLQLETATAELAEEVAEEPEPLPLDEEPYVHPSGAFSLALPKRWNQINEDEISAAFGDRLSRVGVIFVNFGEVLGEDELAEFIDSSTEIIADSFTDTYELIDEEDVLADDNFYYVGLSFDEGEGVADLFFEQVDTVVFVLYFASLQYAEMDPTWSAIIDSYKKDPQAAIAAVPVEEAASPPEPQPPPGPAVPADKGMLIFNNNTGTDFVIDVIGSSNTTEVVPPNNTTEFILDPGHYTINGHSPGGQWTINAYEFDLAAGQVFPLDLN